MSKVSEEIAAKRKEIANLTTKIKNLELELTNMERLNFWWHIILTVATAGFWLIIWLLSSMSFTSKKRGLRRKITNLTQKAEMLKLEIETLQDKQRELMA